MKNIETIMQEYQAVCQKATADFSYENNEVSRNYWPMPAIYVADCHKWVEQNGFPKMSSKGAFCGNFILRPITQERWDWAPGIGAQCKKKMMPQEGLSFCVNHSSTHLFTPWPECGQQYPCLMGKILPNGQLVIDGFFQDGDPQKPMQPWA